MARRYLRSDVERVLKSPADTRVVESSGGGMWPESKTSREISRNKAGGFRRKDAEKDLLTGRGRSN